MRTRRQYRRPPENPKPVASSKLKMALSSLLAAVFLAVLMVPTTAAFAAAPAAVRNTKTANATLVHPGDTFNWMIEVGCSVLTDECVNAVLSDNVPPEFILPNPNDILLTPALSAAEHTTTITGQNITVAFHQDLLLPAGQKGLTNGTVTVTIPVTVRSDLDYTPTPLTVTNTSEMVADNAPMVPSSASVDIDVPLEVETTATKSFSPASNISVAGLSTQMTLGGQNTSNAPVSTLTIQDPVNPAAAGNIFTSTLELQSLDSVTWPTGATSATLSLWDPTVPGWVDAAPVNVGDPLILPAGVTPSSATGVKIVFSSGALAAIPRGVSGSLVVGLQNRVGITAGTHPNTVQSQVYRDGFTDTDTATANYVVDAATSEVSAGKTIIPDRMSSVAFGAGDLTHGVVTLTGGNAGTVPLASMTIAEPSDPTDLTAANPLAPAHTGGGLFFDGFTGGVAWPAGATAATITYYYSDGSNTVQPAVSPTLPAPSSATRVTGFSVTFTGTMAAGVAATLPFTIEANPTQVDLSVLYTNQVKVSGVDVYAQVVAPKFATDTVTVLSDQVNLSTTKALTRSNLRASSGQATIAKLTTVVADYPDTTRSIDQIVMVDPSTGTGLTDWYNYFDATELVFTQVPSDSTLEIQYRDALGNYTTLTTLNSGMNSWVIPPGVRDSIYGIRLVWNTTTGYQPGQTLAANIQYALRTNLRDGSGALPNAAKTLQNCSGSSGTSAAVPPLTSNTAVSSPCPQVTLIPTTTGPGGGGTADFLDKTFINTNNTNPQGLINTRSDATTRVRLAWSTDGYTGINQMVIYDGAVDTLGDPDPASYSLGMYDAFELRSIPAITNALDPLIQYDKVYVQLFNRTTNQWESTGYCPPVSPCFGATPLYNLTTTERSTTIGVRFVFSEGTNRTGLDPAVGSGVAESINHNRRIDLVYQLRNTLRSPLGYPVVDGYQYNAPLTVTGNSVIRNDAQSTATYFDASVKKDNANDTIELQDPILAVSVVKTWTGGSLPIPDSTVTQWPTSRVSIAARNQTVGRVASLTISEPNSSATLPNDTPFENFDLTRFQSITHPGGATFLTVTVTRTAGGNLTASGSNLTTVRNTVYAWTPAQLKDATGFTFVYTGRITAGTTGTVEFDLGLRETTRTAATPVTPGTKRNSTDAVVADSRWDSANSTPQAPTFTNESLQAVDDATIDLVASTIAVTTSKTFAKPTETEPDRSIFTLTLTARPSGSERVKSLTITDDRATFWNAFDMTGVPASTPVLPQFSPTSALVNGTVIQVEVCIGSTWTAGDIVATPDANCVARGGHWVAGTWMTQAQAQLNFLPTGITASQVEGVRLTVRRLDDSQWENPQAPIVSIPLLVQRRLTLRSGGAVLTNFPGNLPSPGETVTGRTTNSLTADVLGIWGKSATATNSANYRYLFATSGVEVQKTPAGVKAPGRLFDYTLNVTNTGNWPIENPVITDILPSDGVGAQLIFDPDKPWTYKYALTGAAPTPATGIALPTGTTGPTVAVIADSYGPTRITFTFPVGSVLEIGQVYKITIPMMFRPGLVNNTDVTNSFNIRGDRKFDSCTAPAGFAATYDLGTGECSTETTVKPSEQAALRALMTVRADLDASYPTDQGFTGGTNADCLAAEDSDGFSRLPCIPLTLPGQKETWRLTAQNTGTTQMPRLVLSARLPDVSDTTILDGFVRNSRWAAGFADEITANIGVPGAVLTTYYTTDTTPCKLVLQNPANVTACGSNPATGWAPWTAGALADPTLVTALQFVIDFPNTHLFQPAELITIDIVTRTASLSATPGSNTTANNSLSASAITRTGVTDTPVTALDYSVVSVALATGSVLLSKTLTGPAATFIPDGQTFTGQLVCTSLGDTLTRSFTLTADTTTTPPTIPTLQFDNLPGGASCTVTETTASGQTSYTATTVTINPLADPAALPNVVLNNDYQLGGLTVSKTVTTTAPIIPTGFAFTVVCTFLGAPVTLAPGDASFTLDATQSHTITGLPANADCVVTETDTKAADATIVTASTNTANTGSSVAIDNTVPSATFTRISPNDIAGVTNSTTFNNRFDAPAALIVTKHVLGGGGTQFGLDKTFSVLVNCTFGATTQYNGSVLLHAGNGWQAVIDNIIAGSTCTFTEADLHGADAVEITPNDGVDTTVGTVVVPGPTVLDPSPIVNIAVNNWYLTGSLQVTKTFAGDAAAIDKFARNPVPAIEFEFTLSCERGGVAVVIPGGQTRTVTAAAPVANYTGIASGANCVLAETGTGGASQTRILDGVGNPVPGGAFTITVNNTILSATDQAQPPLDVENTFRFAALAAKKSVVDARAGTVVSALEFELTLACTLNGRTITAAEPAVATIHDSQTVTWTELAEGADCTITENKTGGATRTSTLLTLADGSIGSAVIGAAATLAPLRWTGATAPNQITFVNSYQLAYTGSSISWASALGLPIGMLLGGAILVAVGIVSRRRRRQREADAA